MNADARMGRVGAVLRAENGRGPCECPLSLGEALDRALPPVCPKCGKRWPTLAEVMAMTAKHGICEADVWREVEAMIGEAAMLRPDVPAETWAEVRAECQRMGRGDHAD